MPAVGIDQVIITVADAPRVQLRRILSICEGIPVRAQMIPLMYDLPLSPPKSLGITGPDSFGPPLATPEVSIRLVTEEVP